MSARLENSLLFSALAGFPEAARDLAEASKKAASVPFVEKVRNFHDYRVGLHLGGSGASELTPKRYERSRSVTP